MKALSIKNPWAMLIAHGIKDIENRTWRTTYRGRIYVHSSAKGAEYDFTDAQYEVLVLNKNVFRDNLDDYIFSAIIGEVDIIDCVQNHASLWAEHKATKVKEVSGEKIEVEVPVWNWVLANPVLYDKPIENVKGALSLWDYCKP